MLNISGNVQNSSVHFIIKDIKFVGIIIKCDYYG